MKLLCSNALKAVFSELLPPFEERAGAKVTTIWASTNLLLARIAQGERGDLAVLTAEAIDDLTREDVIAAGSRVDLARSAIGIAVRRRAPRPDISSAAACKAALLAARSIACSKTGVSGAYFPALLERLGIDEAVKPKLVFPEPGVPVGEVVTRGDAELGVQQISELLPVPGVEIVGPLPPELQKVTIFSAGLFTRAPDALGAKSLVLALTDPRRRRLYTQKGMEPVF